MKREVYSSSTTSPRPTSVPIVTSKNVGMCFLSANTGVQSRVMILSMMFGLTDSDFPVIKSTK